MQLSVILPVYNAERYVAESVRSILEQTFTDFELLVIDDGSTDNSAAVVRGFSDPRIRIITNAENKGQTRAFNIGAREAKGEFIARQDADDRSEPTRLAEQLAHMRANPSIALLGTDMKEQIDDNIRVTNPRPQNPAFKDLLKHNSIVGASVMIRHSVVDGSCLYDETFKLAEDYELTLRMAKRHRVSTLSRPLYIVRTHADSTSRRGADAELLWAMLARDLHDDPSTVDAEMIKTIAEHGITAYLDAMPKPAQIWYYERRASACKRHKQYHAAARHYEHLEMAQGWRLGVMLKRWLMEYKAERRVRGWAGLVRIRR